MERVAHEHDARPERDLVSRHLIGIAGAVETFVTGADDAADLLHRGGGVQDPLTDDRVPLHVLPLRVIEGAGLVQDRVGDRNLAEIVEAAAALMSPRSASETIETRQASSHAR